MTKIQAGSTHTSQVTDCQVHAIGRAIRSVFADPVTFTAQIFIQHHRALVRIATVLGKVFSRSIPLEYS